MLFRPPVLSLSTSGPVSCVPKDNYTWTCTVTGGGNIGITMNYAQTTGRFHFRSYVHQGNNLRGQEMIGEFQKKLLCDGAGVCSLTPSKVCSSFGYDPVGRDYDLLCKMANCTNGEVWKTNGCEDPVLTLPQKNFTWNYITVGGCSAPNEPNISGPASGCTNIPLSYTATATDTNSPAQQVKYNFDWDNNGTVDQSMPAAGYVNSGTGQTVDYSWTTQGAKTFKVQTENACGSKSGWTSYNVNIDDSTCTATDGACGTADGKTYALIDPFPGADTFCSLGNLTPVPPPNPTLGGNYGDSTTWQCAGSLTTDTCSAERESAAITCGTADGKKYDVGVLFPAGDTLCSSGSSVPPAPTLGVNDGDTTTWTCGAVSCDASRQDCTPGCVSSVCFAADCGLKEAYCVNPCGNVVVDESLCPGGSCDASDVTCSAGCSTPGGGFIETTP